MNIQVKSNKKQVTVVSTFVTLFFLLISSCSAQVVRSDVRPELTPEQVVKEFYDAVSAKNCSRASELRPGYPEQKCKSIKKINSLKIKLEYKDDKISVVHLNTAYDTMKEKKSFSGYLTLTCNGSSWIIKNDSYINNINLSGYLKEIAKLKVPSVSGTGVLEKESILVGQKSEQSDGSASESFTHDLTFGSQAVLESCWTKEILQGKPEDKKIQKQPAYHLPPSKLFPEVKQAPLSEKYRNSIRYVKPFKNQKIVALTFDLCERANEKTGYDAEIINYLRANKVKATFFAGGKWMRSHSEKTMQLMADPLFEIGNHGWTHGNLRVLKGKKVEEQILWTQAQYELLRDELKRKPCVERIDASEMEKIPVNIKVFRFPYGTCSSESLKILAKYGLPAIQWDVVTGDPANRQTAEGITKTVLSQTKPGSIIICHANGRGHGTAQALHLFIPELRERGYIFVTVSELLDMGEIVSTEDCYELRPGDNYHYDKKVGEGTE